MPKLGFGSTTAQQAGWNVVHSVLGSMLLATAVLIGSSLSATSAATAQTALPELLKPIPGYENRSHLRTTQEVLSYVSLNVSLLSLEVAEQISAHHAQRLILNISDRDRYEVELNEAAISSPDQYIIKGNLHDVSEGRFLALYQGRAFIVNVYIGPRLVQLEPQSPDAYALIEVNLKKVLGREIAQDSNTPIAEQGSGRVSENLESFEGMNDAQLQELIKRAQQALQERAAKRLEQIRQLAKEAGYEVTLRKIGEKEGARR
jgi:hypothetical protein